MIQVVERDGTPVRNLQNMLRIISQYYNNIPLIIADGIFGETTKNAVISFQEIYNLPPTGEVDIITFEEIVRVNNLAEEGLRPHRKTGIIVLPRFEIAPGESSEQLNVIKGMVKNIASRFDNINDVTVINEVYDEEFVEIIKQLQELSELEATGIIDKKTFDIISYLYEIYVGGYLIR